MSNNLRKLFKHNPTDKIWWIDTTDKDGGFDFTFDKETFFNMFLDYPHSLTPEQKAIFDKENPYWKDFFKKGHNVMTGKTLPAQMITPEEALTLFEHSTVEEVMRAKDLCDAYREANPCKDADFQWKFFNLLSFIYGAGRIQGIREERSKKSA